jgi:uncharacterized protein YxeA
MKTIFKILVCLFTLILSSCSTIKGPNYNSGKSHNQTLGTRKKVVNREDSRMNKSMGKMRKRGYKVKSKKTKLYKRRRFI